MTDPRAVATYRVQLRPEFGFAEAETLAAYLAKLGISHFYASPYLQATAGSSHGYDVVDPGRINAELGGKAGRDGLCRALAAHGLKHLLDIVPNHMAIRGGDNAWWWDVLENGPSSRYSSFFDVEWRSAGSERVLLPILGDQYGVELENGSIVLERDGGAFLVRYHEHRCPMGPRSVGHLLQPVAEELRSDDLGFVADALIDLPSPNATDRASRRRRHRDKQRLQLELERLCQDPAIAAAIDRHLERTNASPDVLHEILERQNYRLAYWRVGNHELDYRRFFDIDSLVGLRIEDEEVLESTHALVLQWIEDGSVDGLRIDHIDGLYDPKQYLERLRQRAPEAWLLVEKILEEGEHLPPWPVEGTTGYDFLNQVQRVLVDPGGEAPLTETYHAFLGLEAPEDYATVVDRSTRKVLREGLASDVGRLVNRLADICQRHRRHRDHSRVELEAAIVELCTAFPVYRTYATPSAGPSEQDCNVIRDACRRALERRPRLDPRLIEFIEQIMLFEITGEEETEFVMRFQQLSGPAMAKGVEDTTFYRYNRFVALNEVGGDPSHFALEPDDFHHRMEERQRRCPFAINATSTHDTKRSEDVRARLLVLSEIPQVWRETVERWSARMASHKTAHVLENALPVPDPRFEYALWQNLVGAWPLDRERMASYVEKSVREAKLYSSWQSPSEPYEQAVMKYLDGIYADAELCSDIDRFVASIATAGYANSLAQVALKVLCPGVPDIYQGTELWDFSLVDPDNRRPVDYGMRQRLLAELESASPELLWEAREHGAVKMHFVRETLALRARQRACFGAEGTYVPLSPEGSHGQRVLAFQRGRNVVTVATRWWMKHGSEFGTTSLSLPPGEWTNVLTKRGRLRDTVDVATILGPFPAAVLERRD